MITAADIPALIIILALAIFGGRWIGRSRS
jgi:hypothetical protein